MNEVPKFASLTFENLDNIIKNAVTQNEKFLAQIVKETQVCLYIALSWWAHLSKDDHPTKDGHYEGKTFCSCESDEYNTLLQWSEWDRCIGGLVDYEGASTASIKAND